MKAIFKLLLFFLLLLVTAFFTFAFMQGGFGTNPSSIQLTASNDPQFLFAHRGVVTRFPENSREAVEEARQMHFKGLEVDIRKTADNQFVLFHDEDAKRLLGINRKISEMTLQEVLNYQLLHNGSRSQSTVLTLQQLLADYHNDFTIYLDMKLGDLEDIDELVHLIRSNHVSESVIVASVSVLVILYIKYKYPDIRTSMEGFNSGNEWAWYLIPRNLKPDFLSGFASKVDKQHMDWLKKLDLINRRVVYGTDSTNYQLMVDLGIRNMIIDSFDALQTR